MAKDRSISQPRVSTLVTISPPLNGGIFGVSVPYTAKGEIAPRSMLPSTMVSMLGSIPGLRRFFFLASDDF